MADTYLVWLADLEQVQTVGIPLGDDIPEVLAVEHFVLIHSVRTIVTET